MSEETNKPLDEKKKTALLRYILILFAAAFLIVLLSLLSQMRDTRHELSKLNQSSSSALQKAEQLQDTNRQLEEENERLQQELDTLQAQLAESNARNEALGKELLSAVGKEKEAYELLLTAMTVVTPGSQEGNVAASRALENLKNYEEYLGEEGLKIYHSLLEEGE